MHTVNMQNIYDIVLDILETDSELFRGLGCLPREYRIKLQPNAAPVVHARKKVPVSLKKRLKVVLKRLCKLGVLVSYRGHIMGSKFSDFRKR